MGNYYFSLFCFRFTVYNEEQLFFIEIHVLFLRRFNEGQN